MWGHAPAGCIVRKVPEDRMAPRVVVVRAYDAVFTSDEATLLNVSSVVLSQACAKAPGGCRKVRGCTRLPLSPVC